MSEDNINNNLPEQLEDEDLQNPSSSNALADEHPIFTPLDSDNNQNHTVFNQQNNLNIMSPLSIMPAEDMANLEGLHPGAIDRILTMSEDEQKFAHKTIEKDQAQQAEVTQRNINISKEQSIFNFLKLFAICSLIGATTFISYNLFKSGQNWAGGAFFIFTLLMSSIFLLGKPPDDVLKAIFGRNSSSNEQEKLEE